MAMKQMPLDGDDLGDVAQTMGLRVKNAPYQDTPRYDVDIAHGEADIDDPDMQQKQFELDKKRFAQQMKDELLGRKPKAAPQPQPPATLPAVSHEEETKEAAHATIQHASDDSGDDEPEILAKPSPQPEEEEKSFNSQIEVGEAVVKQSSGSGANDDDNSFQTPPVQKHPICTDSD